MTGKKLTLKEKMLMIKKRIEQRPDFEKEEHRCARYGKFVIGYYIVDDEYFTIKYGDYEVNVNGSVEAESLEKLKSFNLEKWINDLLEIIEKNPIIADGKDIVEQNKIIIGGKKYIFIPIEE